HPGALLRRPGGAAAGRRPVGGGGGGGEGPPRPAVRGRLRGAAVDARPAALGPGDPHLRRAPDLQLPPLAGGVRGAGVHRGAVAGLPGRRLRRLPARVPAAGAAVRADLRAGEAALVTDAGRNLTIRIVTSAIAMPIVA